MAVDCNKWDMGKYYVEHVLAKNTPYEMEYLKRGVSENNGHFVWHAINHQLSAEGSQRGKDFGILMAGCPDECYLWWAKKVFAERGLDV